MSPNLPALLTVADVIKLLQVSRVTLWQMRRSGRFPAAIRLGANSVRFRAADVEKWLRERPPA